MALTAVGVLAIDGLPRIRIQPPRSRDWIELSGQIAWLSQSKKEAGVRFDDLTTEVQIQIKKWIESEITAAESPTESERFARRKALLLANPKIPISAPSAPKFVMSHEATVGDSLQPEQKDLSAAATLPQPRVISDEKGNAEVPPGLPERRLKTRRRVKSLSYIELSESNGGIVLNMSEDGLHVQAAVTLTGDCFPLMRFQSPHAGNHIETGGKVVWTSKSKREAGIQFVDLSEGERARIREWVLSQPSQIEVHGVKETAPGTGERLAETQVTHEPEEHQRRDDALVPDVQRAIQPAKLEPMSDSSPDRAEVRIAVSGTSIHSRELTGGAKQKLDGGTKVGRPYWGVHRRSWVATVAIFIVVVISFVLGRLAARQSAGVDVPMTAEISTAPANQSSDGSHLPPASRHAGLPAHSVESAPLPSHHEVPARVNSNASVPSPATIARPGGRAAEGPPQRSRSNTTTPTLQGARSHDDSTKVPPSTAAANTSSVPPNDKPSQSPGKMLAQPRDTVTEALGAPSTNSQSVPAVIVKKEVSTPPLAKPLESAPVPLGSVSVSFPPFPSLRVPPELKSQTARLGASLQFGQLVSRVDPAYPEDARRQRVEGTVKLHAIIGRDGAIQSVTFISGPALLAPSAISAVQAWRFKQTLLGGQAIEAEEDIVVVFRLTNPPARST